MGNSHSHFQNIETKYRQDGVDYIVYKYNQRSAQQQTKDEVQRLNDHSFLQVREDVEFLNQEIKKLKQTFEDAKNEAETHKKGSIQESEAKSKQIVDEFSGYNAEVKKLIDLQNEVRQKHAALRNKIEAKVDEELRKVPNKSNLKELREYDSKSDKERKIIEDECLKKYPERANEFSTVELERNLNYENFKGDFLSVLDREQVKKDSETGRNHVKNNIIPSNSAICC